MTTKTQNFHNLARLAIGFILLVCFFAAVTGAGFSDLAGLLILAVVLSIGEIISQKS